MIQDKKWDSENFRMKVGQIVSDGICSKDILLSDIQNASDRGYQLLYLIGEEVDEEILSDSFYLVDVKRKYVKKNIGTTFSSDDCVCSWKNRELDAGLLSLALQSGSFSRYYADKNLPLTIFLKLYKSWIENSLNGTIATDVLVYKRNDDILALLTYNLCRNEATIGLVCVDESAVGRGIGTKLMHTFFSILPEGVNISVSTQKANTKACSFYEKNGFYLESEANVYHIWPEKYINSK